MSRGMQPGQVVPGGLPDRVLTELGFDGGWLTVDGVAELLHADRFHVDRTLFRLRSAGRVESRIVELASISRSGNRGKAGIEVRTEWRVV